MTGIIFPHNGLIKKKKAAGGGAFTPESLTDSIWFDGSDTSVLKSADTDASTGQATITNGGGVYSWQAKGSYSTLSLMTQITSADRPTWNSTGYLTFDGSSDYLGASNLIFPDDGTLWSLSAFTAFALVKANPATSRELFGEASGVSGTPYYLPMVSGSGTASNQAAAMRTDGFVKRFDYPNTLATGAWDNTLNVIGLTADHSTRELTPYAGTTPGTPFTYSAIAQNITTTRWAIGTWFKSPPNTFFAMDIYQLVICKGVLGTSDISDLVTFLNDKGGL